MKMKKKETKIKKKKCQKFLLRMWQKKITFKKNKKKNGA